MRVAIVGAGPSGLAAAKAFLAEQSINANAAFSITVFERRQQVGGAWNYTPFTHGHAQRKPRQVPSVDPSLTDLPRPIEHIHDKVKSTLTWDTPMYRDLYTNIPADLMAYSDLPFSNGKIPLIEQFPHRNTVLDYLERYGEDVKQYIRFDTEVTSISKTGAFWKIIWRAADSESNPRSEGEGEGEAEFDRVVMACGHYEVPKLPEIAGIREYDRAFPDRIRHSKYYRSPDEYSRERVLVIGAGPSAIDISAQLGSRDNPVYRSIRSANPSLATDNEHIIILPQISHLQKDGTIVLSDGTDLKDIDILLFCTGYLYSFPALKLDPAQGVTSPDGEYLHNLYEQLIYRPDPTLAFLAMQTSIVLHERKKIWLTSSGIVPFPIAEAQSCYLARVWSGRIALPDQSVMARAEEEVMQKKGFRRQCMVLGHPEDGEYIDRLRRCCLESDIDAAHGKLPVDWMKERVQLRENTRSLKQEWLALRSKKQGLCSSIT